MTDPFPDKKQEEPVKKPTKVKLSEKDIHLKALDALVHDPIVLDIAAKWVVKLGIDYITTETLIYAMAIFAGANVAAPEVMVPVDILAALYFIVTAFGDAIQFWEDCNTVGEIYWKYYWEYKKLYG